MKRKKGSAAGSWYVTGGAEVGSVLKVHLAPMIDKAASTHDAVKAGGWRLEFRRP